MAKARDKTPAATVPAALSTEEERPAEIDVTDYRIISLLRKDGRMSSRDLATALGHTEATVRARLRRLETTDTMRVVAMTDFRAAGFNLMASIGVQIRDRSAVDVATDIAQLPQVLNVQIVIGTTDIELSVGAGDGEELAQLMDALGNVPGVHRLLPGMALEVIKFQWGWVPFL
jgi:Lrp/AsnC family transcriptional regulator, regulator for asnA, asnC and gidA